MNFEIKKPNVGKMVEKDEIEDIAEINRGKCSHGYGKSKVTTIYKKMMDGKVKDL